MSIKELGNYIYEQHRQGMTDSQIARRLNMTVDELAKILNGEEKMVEEVKPAPKKRGRPKKIVEEPKEEFNWMED